MCQDRARCKDGEGNTEQIDRHEFIETWSEENMVDNGNFIRRTDGARVRARSKNLGVREEQWHYINKRGGGRGFRGGRGRNGNWRRDRTNGRSDGTDNWRGRENLNYRFERNQTRTDNFIGGDQDNRYANLNSKEAKKLDRTRDNVATNVVEEGEIVGDNSLEHNLPEDILGVNENNNMDLIDNNKLKDEVDKNNTKNEEGETSEYSGTSDNEEDSESEKDEIAHGEQGVGIMKLAESWKLNYP